MKASHGEYDLCKIALKVQCGLHSEACNQPVWLVWKKPWKKCVYDFWEFIKKTDLVWTRFMWLVKNNTWVQLYFFLFTLHPVIHAPCLVSSHLFYTHTSDRSSVLPYEVKVLKCISFFNQPSSFSDKIALEGVVVQRAECRPAVSESYMKLKRWVFSKWCTYFSQLRF